MIQGLISDIHGNLAALKAVIADMEQSGAKRVICLGDVVGGPFPGECLDLAQSCGAVLMGNHEEAPYGADNFNPRARRAIDWTREHIKADGGPEIVAQREKVLKNLRICQECELPFLRMPLLANPPGNMSCPVMCEMWVKCRDSLAHSTYLFRWSHPRSWSFSRKT